jgi:branched-chain amino acid transport system substrate-binding protein
VFEITAKDEGLTIVGKESYSSTAGEISESEFQAIASRILAAEPDLVYIAGGVGSNSDFVAGALRTQRPDIAIMGPDGMVSDDLFAAIGADKADGFYGTNIALPADKLGTPEADKFLKDYQAAYGKAPGAYDAAAYEAMGVLLYAIGKAEEPTREGVLESMQNLGDYTGIFGTWHFDEQGDISVSGISGLQAQNGAWVFVSALK